MHDTKSVRPAFRDLSRGAAVGWGRGIYHGIFLVRDVEEFAAYWSLFTCGSASPTVATSPDIDFSTETVVVLALGERPRESFSLSIEAVGMKDRTLVVDATEDRSPGGFDMIVSPIHIISVPFNADAIGTVLLRLTITNP